MHDHPGYRIATLVSLLAFSALCACGGDDGASEGSNGFPPDTTCGAALVTSGAVDLRIVPSRSSTACATGVSSGTGLSISFIWVSSPLMTGSLDIAAVMEGETGDGFPATLAITHSDGREWSSAACTAEISEHEDLGPGELGWERYQVAGSVECDALANTASASDPALELESFDFIASIQWGG